jgi:hypothetical protein
MEGAVLSSLIHEAAGMAALVFVSLLPAQQGLGSDPVMCVVPTLPRKDK